MWIMSDILLFVESLKMLKRLYMYTYYSIIFTDIIKDDRQENHQSINDVHYVQLGEKLPNA